jgi:hypothetical protein
MVVTIARRMSRLWRSATGGQRSSRPWPDVDWRLQFETLEARARATTYREAISRRS